MDDVKVPDAVWNQDMPTGGADELGRIPGAAVAVVPVGVVTVRDVAALRATAGTYTLTINQTVRLVGRSPQRRRLLVCATADYMLCTDENTAQAGVGMTVTSEQPVALETAGEVWLRAVAAGSFGFWSEYDEG